MTWPAWENALFVWVLGCFVVGNVSTRKKEALQVVLSPANRNYRFVIETHLTVIKCEVFCIGECCILSR